MCDGSSVGGDFVLSSFFMFFCVRVLKKYFVFKKESIFWFMNYFAIRQTLAPKVNANILNNVLAQAQCSEFVLGMMLSHDTKHELKDREIKLDICVFAKLD